MSSTRTISRCRSDRLLAVLARCPRLLIVAHDNPDPDAIAAGWAIVELIRQRLVKPVDFVAGGGIIRAENRHMVDLLHPPLQLIGELKAAPDTSAILVDCGVGNTNQILINHAIPTVAVIDHHASPDGPPSVQFRDVRTEVAASASIAASYLREQRIDPGPKLATAVLYAMRTETRGQECEHSALDRSVLTWLTGLADPTLLAEIESAPLDGEYFGDLALAIQNTFLYEGTALCLLPRASGAEIVGEVADLLIRGRGIRRVLCGAVVEDDLFLSVRTDTDGDNAVALLLATIEGIGSGGGHLRRAGGKIPCVGNGPGIAEALQKDLRARWFRACGVRAKQGKRLVPKREIVDNL